MILTPHLLAGAAIASKISNPFLALPLALLSHYFLDSLPHTDYSIKNIRQKRWKKSFVDFLKVFLDICSGIMLILLFSDNNPIIFLAAFSAVMPDGVSLFGIIFPQKKLIIWHQKIHIAANAIGDSKFNKKIPRHLGILSQIALAAIIAWLL